MKNALTLTEKETFFLKENRQDPVTGDGFDIGDEIVFCASCKSAFLKESWEYMNSKHCGQSFTLKKFPVQSKLKLSKPIIYTFQKADSGKRVGAYFIDGFIAIILGILACYIVIQSKDGLGYNNSMSKPISFVVGNIYMLFRDFFGIKSSLGKRIMGLYFINIETQKNASIVILFFKNLVYWGCIIVIMMFIGFMESITGGGGIIASILGFGLLIANIVHIIVLLANQNNIFDRMLKIELVEKKK
ncbi:hypothetical protein Fleli_3304 [Bernardetia litoralis DSM 6794]|uniref:RDD domain-containing protein n=1 Tax=Bernardetia litoralis (strain ATCC 23117 / DSM 6794 / NBRC 15988 / NCIMB 1366 / Fx l1 / Sio-4) TaxID=880071 RepID=I4ANU8_BERLS|nr:RDD family protein [Bernardetia litoralis]AFM05633.1 hypothetical protein Fleli_3304 [Bernardetia litoralis DSM 6794]